MLLMSDNETKRYPVSNGGMVYVDDHRGVVPPPLCDYCEAMRAEGGRIMHRNGCPTIKAYRDILDRRNMPVTPRKEPPDLLPLILLELMLLRAPTKVGIYESWSRQMKRLGHWDERYE